MYIYIHTYIHTVSPTTVVDRSLSEVGNQIAANAGGRLKNIGWLRAARVCICIYDNTAIITLKEISERTARHPYLEIALLI